MPPEIFDTAGHILGRYDALVCDVWGVVHDGERAYPAAGEALARFRAGGGTVVLLSNSPMPSEAVIHVLDDKGVRRDSFDAIITSGDIARSYLQERRLIRVYHLGPERDLALFEGTDLQRVSLEAAEVIVCTGFIDDRNHSGETYRPLLESALALDLKLVCANPDLVVDVGDERLPCAGTLAALYESIGGDVIWAGKPYAPAYQRVFNTIDRLRGETVSKNRILAIGDAIRIDIAGAAQGGIEAVFVTQGIHNDELMAHGKIMPERLKDFLEKESPEAISAIIAVMPALAW